MSSTAPTKGLILISGITGFLASAIAHAFLVAGYTVRGTTRTASKASAIASAPAFAAATAERRLEIVLVPDITADHAFDEAVIGVQWFIHAASPIPFGNINDSEHEILIPTVRGTLAALNAATKEPQIKKVIVVSSIAAVVDYSKASQAGIVYNESNWAPGSYELGKTGSPGLAYIVAKTVAEKAAWDFVASEKPSFQLIATHPTSVFGENLAPLDPSEPIQGSNTFLSTLLLDPAYNPATAVVPPNFVDVSDVAKAHVLAVENDAADGRRFILSGPTLLSSEWIRITTRVLPSYAPHLPRPLDPAAEQEQRNNSFTLDNRASKEVLGLVYRAPEETLRDAAEWILQVSRSGKKGE